MKDGVVQQVDTPQNLYEKPGNLFVAGFMGSPQMNFLDAQIVEKGNNLIAKIGDNDVVIPAAKAKVLKESGYVGKTVVLGIRPEDIHDSQMFIEASPSAPMTSTVKVYELLGAEVFLYFDVNGTQLTARVDPRTTSKLSLIHIFVSHQDSLMRVQFQFFCHFIKSGNRSGRCEHKPYPFFLYLQKCIFRI